jgi:flagellar biosynthesis/type III secretory pathway M-ring protein FliF/YscJ
MISKLLVVVFTFIQNQDQLPIEEMARQEKMNNLTQLISLLSIFLLIVVILLIIYVVKNYKLKGEIKQLKSN